MLYLEYFMVNGNVISFMKQGKMIWMIINLISFKFLYLIWKTSHCQGHAIVINHFINTAY